MHAAALLAFPRSQPGQAGPQLHAWPAPEASSVPRARPWFPWHWAPSGPKSSGAAPAPTPQQGLTLLLPAPSRDHIQTPPARGHQQHHLPMVLGQDMQHCWAHQSSASSSRPTQDPADPSPIPTWGAHPNCQRPARAPTSSPVPPACPELLSLCCCSSGAGCFQAAGCSSLCRGGFAAPSPWCCLFTGAVPVLRGLCGCRKLRAMPGAALPCCRLPAGASSPSCWPSCQEGSCPAGLSAASSSTGSGARHLIPLETPSISPPWPCTGCCHHPGAGAIRPLDPAVLFQGPGACPGGGRPKAESS